MKHGERVGGRSLVAAAVLLSALVLVSCQTAAPGYVKFEVQFTYDSAGVGGEAVREILVLPQDQTDRIVGTAILDALQDLRLSLVSPQLGPETVLPPGKEWATDTVEIDRSLIEAHNQANPALALPLDRVYALQYRGKYAIERHDRGKSLAFSINANLQQRGAGTYRLRPYTRQYSGAFFVDNLKRLIQEELLEATRAR
jgi:hypothetical protein